MDSKYQLIFIGGLPRSGTTLVQRVMASHPDVYAGPEFDLVPKICDIYAQLRKNIETDRISAWLSEDRSRACVKAFIYSLFLEKSRTEQVGYICEKSPHNALAFPLLSELLPEAKLVFVARDPRAVAASCKNVAKRHREQRKTAPLWTYDSLAQIRLFNQYYEQLRIATEKTDNISIVYYEDIVSDPSLAITNLFRKLAIPGMHNDIEASMSENRFEGERAANTFSSWYSIEELRRPISGDSLERWRSELSADEARRIERQVKLPSQFGKRYFEPNESVHCTPNFGEKAAHVLNQMRARRVFPRMMRFVFVGD